METNSLTETAGQSVVHEVMKEVVAKLDPQVFACRESRLIAAHQLPSGYLVIPRMDRTTVNTV